MEHGGDGNTNYNWCGGNNFQRNGNEAGRLGNKKTSGDYTDNRIIKISQNTRG